MDVNQLPQYRCHKVVSAAKIAEFQLYNDGTGQLRLELPEQAELVKLDVDAAWAGRFSPKAGEYLVVYEDGYKSVSPAKAFEEGYARIE